MEPLNKYVLLEAEKEQEKTEGGLYMPQGSNKSAVDILKKGKVLAVSKKVSEDAPSIVVGGYVYYNKHAITKIPNDATTILVRLEDLYATIK